MKILQTAAVASTVGFYVLAFGTMTPARASDLPPFDFGQTAQSPARADTLSRPGNYCMEYGEAEVECDFATLNQCRQSASGLQGECYPDVWWRPEDSFAYAPRMAYAPRIHGRRLHGRRRHRHRS
ncbi:hypothetical protein V1291_004662 [Nitrobacteraceae bacterium AZCC 1564]